MKTMTPQSKKEKIKALLARAESLKPIKSPFSISMNVEGGDVLADKEKDIKPIVEMVQKIKKYFDAKHNEMSQEMAKEFENINSLINTTEEKVTTSSKKEAENLLKQLKSLKKELLSTALDIQSTKDISSLETKQLKEGISQTEGQIKKILEFIGQDSKDKENSKRTVKEELSTIRNTVTTVKKELEVSLDKASKDFIDRISRVESSRGGSMNRQIKVGGTDVLTRYTDVNLVGGTGVTISTSNDNTDKNVDITFTASGFSPQAPTSGAVDGDNKVFVFASAPGVICVDQGRFMQRVSSDGNVNWTIVGTTVTLQVAPTSDLFAL